MRQYLLLLTLLPLVLAGCVDSDITINVKKDGSGTITSKTSLRATKDEDGTPGKKGPSGPDERMYKDIAPILGRGVTLDSFKTDTVSRPGFIKIETVYSFADINKVRLSPFLLTVGFFEDDTNQYKEEMLTRFTFAPGEKSRLTIIKPMPDIKDKGKNSGKKRSTQDSKMVSRESIVGAKKLLRENRLKFRVKVDGKITSTNASTADMRNATVTLIDIDLDKITKDEDKVRRFIRTVNYEEFLGTTYHFVEDIGGADEQFEEIRYDRSPEITIEFK
ncbi:MAG: hypothetical protein OEV59_02755 [Deltaproteobacteria bacterium]|nr:hypothetical protein [Deltaproteobacteria bacterium]